MGFSGIFDWSAQLRDLTDILLLANVEGLDRDSVLRDTGQIPLLNTLQLRIHHIIRARYLKGVFL